MARTRTPHAQTDPSMNESAQAKLQIIAGSALAGTPIWVIMLQDVSLIAGAVAAICGAIVGVHGVYRLWRNRRNANQ